MQNIQQRHGYVMQENHRSVYICNIRGSAAEGNIEANYGDDLSSNNKKYIFI